MSSLADYFLNCLYILSIMENTVASIYARLNWIALTFAFMQAGYIVHIYIYMCMYVFHKDQIAIYQFWDIGASPVINIDSFFAFAYMHSHAHAPRYTHTYTNTCALLQLKRMWLCSPLCVSPPAWQMHLLSKSWWIFSLNSKSKPHFPSPYLLREPFMSAIPPASASNHSLKKLRWKKTSLWILILTTCWAWVMNGSKIYSCIWTPHIRCVGMCCPSLPLSSSQLSFDKLCCNYISVSFCFCSLHLVFSF